jgi:hypothetical protein
MRPGCCPAASAPNPDAPLTVFTAHTVPMQHTLLHRCRTWVTLWVIWAFALVPALSFLSMPAGRVLGTGLDSNCITTSRTASDPLLPPAPLHDGIHCPLCLGSAPPALPTAQTPVLIRAELAYVSPRPLQNAEPRASSFPSRSGLTRAPPVI